MNTKFLKSWICLAVMVCGFVSAGLAATPFTTVPWNGHSGAASFTFDDAMASQVTELTPILNEMPQVRVTFFLTDMGFGILNEYAEGFANLAKMGNEIGNHSKNHLQLPNLDNASQRAEVIDFADEIESVMAAHGANVDVTASAPPFCGNSDELAKVINERHFINRLGGWHGRNRWDVEPRWTEIDSRSWYNYMPNYIENWLSALDTAANIGDFSNAQDWESHAKGPSWIVLLHHGIGNGGEYDIKPEEIRRAFNRAVQNNMWVAPFSTVGAYYRAHFTLDAANAVAEGDKFVVRWALPHKNMPKSIPMKVNLNKDFIEENLGHSAYVVLEQNGKEIYPDETGAFTIEFTDLEVTIRKKTPKPQYMPGFIGGKQETTNGIHSFDFYERVPQNGSTTYTLYDMKGKNLGKVNDFEVPSSMPKGVYMVRAVIPGAAPVTKKLRH